MSYAPDRHGPIDPPVPEGWVPPPPPAREPNPEALSIVQELGEAVAWARAERRPDRAPAPGTVTRVALLSAGGS